MKDESKAKAKKIIHTPDVEALALAARARRVAVCEQAVLAAIGPILARYRCRLGTVQEVVDGRPGPVRVVVMAVE
ncbi:MAG: hypothetical protein ABI847_20270 [Anaerolineales bacterium]